MLVLRRKVGESICIGDTIVVTILAVEGQRIKIGVSAPDEVSVVREELLCKGADVDLTQFCGEELPMG